MSRGRLSPEARSANGKASAQAKRAKLGLVSEDEVRRLRTHYWVLVIRDAIREFGSSCPAPVTAEDAEYLHTELSQAIARTQG